MAVQADFENNDLWLIYDATVSGGSGLEVGVTPITGGNSQGVLFNNVGVLQNTGAFTYNSATNILGVNTISPNGSNNMEIRRASGRAIIFADTGGNDEWYINNVGEFSEASLGQTINVTNLNSNSTYLNLSEGGSPAAVRIVGTIARMNTALVESYLSGYGSNPLNIRATSGFVGVNFQNHTGTKDYLSMSPTGDFTVDSNSQFITAGAQFSRTGNVWLNELGNDAYLSGHNTSGYGLFLGIGAVTDPSAFPTVALGIASTTRGFLPPVMTDTQRTAISSPEAGLIVYDNVNNKHYGYDGTTWNAFY